MRGRFAKIAAMCVALVIAAGVGIVLRAEARVHRVWEMTPPAIAAATGADAIARGERIFMAACFDCHVSSETGKASGGRMPGIAPSLGVIHAANITADPAGGIGEVPDDRIALVIRTGVRRDGRLALGMPAFPAMGDADVAALLGFLRSPAGVLEPVPAKQPERKLTRRGALAFAAAIPASRGATTGIVAPAASATLDYGRYLADDVYRCGECHASPRGEPYLGGAVFDVAGGGRVVSPNLTPSPTNGIGSWTFSDFARAVRDGIAKGGFVLHHPMPRLRLSDDAELGAIYAYLMSQAPRDVDRPRVAGELPRETIPFDAKPADLFLKLGCPSCHAKGAPYAVKIRHAKGKPVEEVAAWIRNPQERVPGTPMPTFATLLSEEQSTQLAAWILERLEDGYRF